MQNQTLSPIQFIAKIAPFIESQTENNLGLTVILKDSAASDHDKLKEIKADANKVAGITELPFPKVGFIFPKSTGKETNGYQFLILHEEDIEDGGPQPRLHILDDPVRLAKVNAIANSIEIEGQRDPIDVYPSPLNNGKYRVCEGRLRHTAVFGILKPNGRRGNDGKIIDYILAKAKKQDRT